MGLPPWYVVVVNANPLALGEPVSCEVNSLCEPDTKNVRHIVSLRPECEVGKRVAKTGGQYFSSDCELVLLVKFRNLK